MPLNLSVIKTYKYYKEYQNYYVKLCYMVAGIREGAATLYIIHSFWMKGN